MIDRDNLLIYVPVIFVMAWIFVFAAVAQVLS